MHRSPASDRSISVPIVGNKADLCDENENLMRRFIRHPSSVPLQFDVIECGHGSGTSALINVGQGGLCFASDVPLPKGARVRLAIPIDSPPFEVMGRVAWCKIDGCAFLIGVSFDDNASNYSVRMVEQVCYIEHYRHWVSEHEGRELSSDQAAKEWVDRYAADFPMH